MAGLSGPVYGNLTSFQQWVKINLGFYLRQTDAAETAIGTDHRTYVAQDGTWVVMDTNIGRVASREEISMWEVLQEWWDIIGRVQAMIPMRKNDDR